MTEGVASLDHEFQKFLHSDRIKHILCSPDYPAGNAVERYCEVAKRSLRAYLSNQQPKWMDFIQKIQLSQLQSA